MTLPGATTAHDEGARRGAAPWLVLAATDCLAIATLARCFSGAGELWILVPTCLVTHLIAGGLRRSGRGGGLGTAGGYLAALLAGLLLPLALVDGGTFSYGILPLGHTWHVVGRQLADAWTIFSHQLAPVAEQPGLVLVAGWAAAALALAAEVLYADVGLPAFLALVPAFDVVVFTGTLGTSTGRAPEIAGIVGLAVAFLFLAPDDRSARRPIIMARTEGSAARAPIGDDASSNRRLSTWTSRSALGGISVCAAVAAGVVGPILPGATSAPLVAWHGGRAAPGSASKDNRQGGGKPNHISVSSLVQVGQQEIDNADVLLLSVHSTRRTREMLVTLDHFDGNHWTRNAGAANGAGKTFAVTELAGSIGALERHPPAAVTGGNSSATLKQVVQIGALGGSYLPAPGSPIAVAGDGTVSQLGRDGPLVPSAPLSDGLTYAIQSDLPPSQPEDLGVISAFANPGNHAADLQLPGQVPAQIVALAHQLIRGDVTPYDKAVSLQAYFHGNGFVYRLPTRAVGGAVQTGGEGYGALLSFLFTTRTGYCQQYASAFAVLARVDGLPTRVAVGFLPGKEIDPNEYVVTGTDVHAWPQVQLGNAGWVDFEPTPGAAPPRIDPIPLSGPVPTTVVPHVTTTTRPSPAHNLAPARGGGGGGGGGTHTHHARHHRVAGGGSSGVLDVLLGALGLAAAWIVGVPLWRIVRRQRERRDPRRATAEAWRSATWVLAAAGVHRRRAETHREFARRVRTSGLLSDTATDALDRLALRMDRVMFSRLGPDAGDPANATTEAAAVRRSARRRIAWWQRLTLVVDPRDLVRTG